MNKLIPQSPGTDHRQPRRRFFVLPRALGRALAISTAIVLLVLTFDTAIAKAAPPNEPDDRAARRALAEALFDQGKSLMASNQFHAACPKFAESQKLDAGVGTLLNLADCLEKIGRTASAWAEFRAAAAAAREKRQEGRETIARQRALALEPRLSWLVISVSSDNKAKNLEIRKDGQIISRALWGTAVPVDPGMHVVEANAEGKRPFRAEVDVPESGSTRIATTIPQLMDETQKPVKSNGRPQRIAGLTLGSVGVISLVTGGILGAQAIARNNASNDHCISGNLCNAMGVTLRSEASIRGNAATATIIAGALAATGGVILYLTASETMGSHVGVGAVGSGTGMVLGGAF